LFYAEYQQFFDLVENRGKLRKITKYFYVEYQRFLSYIIWEILSFGFDHFIWSFYE
jgi:hypothetical protein